MLRFRVLTFFIVLLFSSCTSQKRLVYFQGALPPMGSDSIHVLRIYPGDIITISVFTINAEAYPYLAAPNEKIDNRQPYEKGYVVSQTGEVKLPLIGSVQLKGLTIEESSLLLEKKFNDYIDDPIVTVKKLNFKITVIGEVNSPGVFTIMDEKATLPEVLGLAGDITPFGDREKLRIIREENGQRKDLYVDLTNSQSLIAENYYLHPNDIVYVQPLRRRAFQNASPTVTLLTSLITSTIVVLTFIAVSSE